MARKKRQTRMQESEAQEIGLEEIEMDPCPTGVAACGVAVTSPLPGAPAQSAVGVRARVADEPCPALVESNSDDGPAVAYRPSLFPHAGSSMSFVFEDRCRARVWNEGVPRQCTRRPVAGSKLCTGHARNLPHGTMEGEMEPSVLEK